MKQIGLAAAVAVVGLMCGGVFAQQPRHDERHPEPGPGGPAKSMMGQKCAMMEQKMDSMHDRMKSEQQKIRALLQEMNTATGSAKTEAMAAAINAIGSNCDEMHRMESDMMRAMMEHMSEHMAQGGPKEMQMCPMMQGHGDATGGEHGEHSTPAPPPGDAPKRPAPSEPTPDDHSEHHPNP